VNSTHSGGPGGLPPHVDQVYLSALNSVRSHTTVARDPEDLIKAIAVLVSCRESGNCSEPDKHEAEIARFFNWLAGGE
jgi:hypothetical protein